MTLKRNLIKRDAAKRDITELAVYIAFDSLEASDRFIDSTENAIQFLLNTPKAGAFRESLDPTLSGLRMWPIPGFEKHLNFYREIPDGIEIIRVLHSARDIRSIFESEE